jgi:hypothetical protein
VIVDWTDEFDRWLTHAEQQGGRLLAVAVALLQALNDLPAKPEEGVRDLQARPAGTPARAVAGAPTHSIRRSPSGSSAGSPSDEEVVIALVGFDKKAIGDVFHASAAARGEAPADAWLRQKGSSGDRRS